MCGCKKGISGMGKKRKSKGSFEKPLKMVAAGGAALVATEMATEQIGFMQDNPMVSGGVKIAAGVFLAMQKDDLAVGAGMGIGTSGVKDLLDHFMAGSGGSIFSKGDNSTPPGSGRIAVRGTRNRVSAAEYARMRNAQLMAARHQQGAGAGTTLVY